MDKQTLSFQAEVKQILHLVTHSLYSNKEIFLRELISNASRRLRQAALRGAGQRRRCTRTRPTSKCACASTPRRKTLTIRDNGIGMSARRGGRRTWAPSPRAARASSWPSCEGDQKKDANLIGQFGVGFYSGFIVADRITVESRRAGADAR